VDWPPDTQREPPTWRHNSVHLKQRRRPIGKELEPLLTEHEVEGSILKRQVDDIRFPPLNERRSTPPQCASNLEHDCIAVEAHHRASRT
jgi:hypothetical protein